MFDLSAIGGNFDPSLLFNQGNPWKQPMIPASVNPGGGPITAPTQGGAAPGMSDAGWYGLLSSMANVGGAMFPSGTVGSQVGSTVGKMGQGMQVNELMKRLLGPYIGAGGRGGTQSGLSGSPTLTSLDVLGLPPEAVGAVYAGIAKMSENEKDRQLKEATLGMHAAELPSRIEATQANTESVRQRTAASKYEMEKAKQFEKIDFGKIPGFGEFGELIKAGGPGILPVVMKMADKSVDDIAASYVAKGEMPPKALLDYIKIKNTHYQVGGGAGDQIGQITRQKDAYSQAFTHLTQQLEQDWIAKSGADPNAKANFQKLMATMGDPQLGAGAKAALLGAMSPETAQDYADTARYYLTNSTTGIPDPPPRKPLRVAGGTQPSAGKKEQKLTQEDAIKQIVSTYKKEYGGKPPSEYVKKKLADMGFTLK